jgi:hypothetical protein
VVYGHEGRGTYHRHCLVEWDEEGVLEAVAEESEEEALEGEYGSRCADEGLTRDHIARHRAIPMGGCTTYGSTR